MTTIRCGACEARMQLSPPLLEKLAGHTGKLTCKACQARVFLDFRGGELQVQMEPVAGFLQTEREADAAVSGEQGVSESLAPCVIDEEPDSVPWTPPPLGASSPFASLSLRDRELAQLYGLDEEDVQTAPDHWGAAAALHAPSLGASLGLSAEQDSASVSVEGAGFSAPGRDSGAPGSLEPAVLSGAVLSGAALDESGAVPGARAQQDWEERSEFFGDALRPTKSGRQRLSFALGGSLAVLLGCFLAHFFTSESGVFTEQLGLARAEQETLPREISLDQAESALLQVAERIRPCAASLRGVQVRITWEPSGQGSVRLQDADSLSAEERACVSAPFEQLQVAPFAEQQGSVTKSLRLL